MDSIDQMVRDWVFAPHSDLSGWFWLIFAVFLVILFLAALWP